MPSRKPPPAVPVCNITQATCCFNHKPPLCGRGYQSLKKSNPSPYSSDSHAYTHKPSRKTTTEIITAERHLLLLLAVLIMLGHKRDIPRCDRVLDEHGQGTINPRTPKLWPCWGSQDGGKNIRECTRGNFRCILFKTEKKFCFYRHCITGEREWLYHTDVTRTKGHSKAIRSC